MTCELVAELSCNHSGSLQRALNLISACAGTKATIKFQCWHPERMVYDKEFVIKSGLWAGINLYQLYEQAHTPWYWFPTLIGCCDGLELPWFSSVYDVESLAYLERLDCPRYKIASFELVDLPLIKEVAKTKKPIVLSTGMASWDEIDNAILEAGRFGSHVTLLKCTSAYPALAKDANLRTLDSMRRSWDVPVGLSDHTNGMACAIVAASLGAVMIEKHVQFDGSGLDSNFSMYPSEFKRLCLEVENASICLGESNFGVLKSELDQRLLRRSLYFVKDAKAGAKITFDMIRTARPGEGLSPDLFEEVLKTSLREDVKSGTSVTNSVLVR